jgi:peptidylprolyl isomerase
MQTPSNTSSRYHNIFIHIVAEAPFMKSGFFRSKTGIFMVAFLAFIVVMIVISSLYGSNAPSTGKEKVRLSTTMGDIVIELYDDMPITTGNFKSLVEGTIYDGVIFHRVIDGFMIQTGDPTGTGMGDDSIPTIPDEFTGNNQNDRGTVAMANKGPDTGSSQFFINLVDNDYLDSEHPVFGMVIEGIDVVDQIGKVPTDENGRPLEDVRIIKAEFVD